MEDKWIWWMILDLCLRMIRMKGKSNMLIGRTNIMKIEILMVSMILILDTISRITDKDKWMINLKIKWIENTITLHQKDLIMKSRWMMMWLLITKISNMNWIKLWIYMERMIIIITSMNNNLQIKITLITMMNLKISLFLSMNNLMKKSRKINRNIEINDYFIVVWIDKYL